LGDVIWCGQQGSWKNQERGGKVLRSFCGSVKGKQKQKQEQQKSPREGPASMTKSSYGSQISAEDDNEFEFDVKPSTATEYRRTKKGLCTPTFIVMTLLTVVVIAVLICVVILGLLSTFDVISLDTLSDDDDVRSFPFPLFLSPFSFSLD